MGVGNNKALKSRPHELYARPNKWSHDRRKRQFCNEMMKRHSLKISPMHKKMRL